MRGIELDCPAFLCMWIRIKSGIIGTMIIMHAGANIIYIVKFTRARLHLHSTELFTHWLNSAAPTRDFGARACG